ncbi:hypothetical protein QTP86_010735 [Hemibagrus guttatus]|nr:hypothetical protein QTP86_010735 [Hemibagrus guttatus]
MDRYTEETLAAGFIRLSTSPAGAGFFFEGKKGGGLHPCIDYRGLNKITIHNRYPLPLMATAFELPQGASLFTKLDLRNAYHFVRIRQGDEWKMAFNTLTGHCEYLVMPFGLTNAPTVFQALINDVLRDMLNQFVFAYLDDMLIFLRSLPEHVWKLLLCLLDNHLYVKPEKYSDKAFIVEVDASDVGVGAVLSQRGEDNKFHLLFTSPFPTEKNYHVGGLELLAVKLALEECQHWLEGAKHPVQMAVVRGLIDKVDNIQRETRGLKQDIVGCKSDVSKFQAKLAELEDRERRNNVRLLGLAPNREGGDAIRFLTEMLPKWIPSLSNRPIEIERAHRIYGQQSSTETGRTIIFKVLRYQDHQSILDRAREVSKRGPILDGLNRLKFFADYSTYTSQRQRSFADTQKELRASGIQSFLIYPTTLRVMHNGEKLSFSSPHEADEFRLQIADTSRAKRQLTFGDVNPYEMDTNQTDN